VLAHVLPPHGLMQLLPAAPVRSRVHFRSFHAHGLRPRRFRAFDPSGKDCIMMIGWSRISPIDRSRSQYLVMGTNLRGEGGAMKVFDAIAKRRRNLNEGDFFDFRSGET